jgi:deoxyribonuclease-4
MSLAFRFGTVGTPQATPSPGGTVAGIRYSASIGLDAMEIAWVHGVRISEGACASIQASARKSNVSLSVHAPYFINLNCTEDKWPRLKQYLMDSAYYGNLAGATDIIFHPGTYFGKPVHEVMPIVIPRLEGCVKELQTAGNPVTLRPEISGKAAMLGSLDDLLAMADAIPGVLPCLDFAHLHARLGDGAVNSYKEWMTTLDRYQKVLGKKSLNDLHIHLSGIEYGPKGEKNQLIMDEADLDFSNLMRALADVDARGRIMCESPNLEVDALKLKELWINVSGEKG